MKALLMAIAIFISSTFAANAALISGPAGCNGTPFSLTYIENDSNLYFDCNADASLDFFTGINLFMQLGTSSYISVNDELTTVFNQPVDVNGYTITRFSMTSYTFLDRVDFRFREPRQFNYFGDPKPEPSNVSASSFGLLTLPMLGMLLYSRRRNRKV